MVQFCLKRKKQYPGWKAYCRLNGKISTHNHHQSPPSNSPRDPHITSSTYGDRSTNAIHDMFHTDYSRQINNHQYCSQNDNNITNKIICIMFQGNNNNDRKKKWKKKTSNNKTFPPFSRISTPLFTIMRRCCCQFSKQNKNIYMNN